ncbi:RING-type zinc-finger LisH dimerization motif [Trinorchestia longiramus]|nr:RING-type zinc-finger LisH dimerization motif [Trinorchestia longiramus]
MQRSREVDGRVHGGLLRYRSLLNWPSIEFVLIKATITMNVAAVCKVCEEAFNCVDRKPLVLPCGHTYCLACLTAIETSGDKLCPACRESWHCVMSELPVCYMLIPGSNFEKCSEEVVKPDYDAFESASDSLIESKMEISAKQISQCNIVQSSLLNQFKVAAAQFSGIETEIEFMHRKLKTPAFLPLELSANASNWRIDDQFKAQMALNSVKNWTPLPTSVTLISTKNSPIVSLPELLLELFKRQCRIDLQLLDSFLHGVSVSNSYCRLESLMLPDHGKCLDSFYGHVRHSSTWSKLGLQKLYSLGLRLDSGAGVTELNKIVQATSATWLNISISKKVVAAGILAPVAWDRDLRFHFVGLSDGEQPWCLQVLEKLMPLLRNPYYSTWELWLHECTLSKTSIEELVLGAKTTDNQSCIENFRLQLQGLTEADQQHLQEYSQTHSVNLSFEIPTF